MGYRPGRKLRAPQRDRVSTTVSSWVNFNPMLLSPALWLDASDKTTITESGGAVSQLDDKSGNGRNFTQGTAANQPVTNLRTQNGLNVIDFQGNIAAHFLDGGDILDLGTGDISIFSVAQSDQPTIGQMIISKQRITAPSGSWGHYFESSNLNTVYFGTGTRLAAASYTSTNAFVLSSALDRTNGFIRQRQNGRTVAQVSFASDIANDWDNVLNVYIGVLRNAANTGFFGYYLDGFVGEIIICLRAVTDAEINATTSYLMKKWGIGP